MNRGRFGPKPSARSLTRGALLLALAALAASEAAAQPAPRAQFTLPRGHVAQRARRVPVGGRFRLVGVPLEGRTAALDLERFEVFTPNARILVQGAQGKRAVVRPPNRSYFRGGVESETDSFAFLAVGENSDVRGLVVSDGRTYVLGAERQEAPREEPLVVRAVEESLAKKPVPGWRCDSDALPGPSPGGDDSLTALFGEPFDAVAKASAQYSMVVAIETDFELYNLFNSVDLAAAYIGDLMGASSSIYHRDLGTTLRINWISLWTGPGDPWTGNSSCDTLAQFGNYWANPANGRTAIPRGTAHFLSGKAGKNGIAWVGTLCSSPQTAQVTCGTTTYSTYAGGFGVTQGIDGSFNPSSPTVVWDIYGTSHEIGHNFSSPHTHCYNNYPVGGSPPVDQCFGSEGGCYAGSTSLPPGGKGSIMSYCHFLGSVSSSIALSFGAPLQYGTLSERVPQRMRDFVASRASACTMVIDAPPADFNGDGRSEVVIYRNGAWLEFPLWPGR
jgi:metallopeptidase family M12-like protein